MTKKTDWEKVREDYDIFKNTMSLKEFAEKHNVKYSTLRSRKNREQWDNVAEDVATIKIKPKNKTKKRKDASLTDKQHLFCIEYIKCFNATKAYQKVYQCNYNSAMTEGSRHLRNPKIKDQIDILKQNKFNRAMLDEDDIFQKYIDIAFADITDYIDFGKKKVKKSRGEKIVNYVDLKESKEVDGSIISEVTQGKDGTKVKLHDKMKALQWLSDRMDLLSTQVTEKLNLEKEKLELDRLRNQEEVEEYEDDGFLEAMTGEVGEIWNDFEED